MYLRNHFLFNYILSHIYLYFSGGMLGKLFCIQYLCISIHYSSVRIFKVCAIQKMGFIKLSTDGIFYPSYCLYRIPSYCTCKVSKVLIKSNENIPLFQRYLYNLDISIILLITLIPIVF